MSQGGAAGSGLGWEAARKVLQEAVSAGDSRSGIHLPETLMNECQSGIRAHSTELGTLCSRHRKLRTDR